MIAELITEKTRGFDLERARSVTNFALSYLPPKSALAIREIGKSRRDFPSALSEIRIRQGGCSSVVISGENIPVFTYTSERDMSELYRKITGSSLYAHRESIKNGFVGIGRGVRVGLCGSVGYDGGDMIGVCNISSFVFRIPSSPSENGEALHEAFRKLCRRGMLIYSAPGGGKTSALRALASLLGGGESKKRVVIVDERREFVREDYKDRSVDLLTGYEKAKGIEIATRVLNPEVIIVDEIGTAQEAAAIMENLGAGVPLIATVHASSVEDARGKEGIKELLAGGYFDLIAGLRREEGRFIAEVGGVVL